jgi:hypothetical protein
MAVSSSTYFSNAIQGIPQTGADYNLRAVDSSPKFPVGTKYERTDGSVFRYSHFGSAVAAARLMAKSYDETDIADLDNSFIAPASATLLADENIQPGNKGSHYIMVQGNPAKNKYAGAYLIITDGDGSRFTYMIKGNTAGGNAATGGYYDFYLELHEPLYCNIKATTDHCIIGSKYNDLYMYYEGTDTPANTSFITPVGVTCNTFTNGSYGFIQTKGICGVLQGSKIPSRGSLLSASVVGDTPGSVSEHVQARVDGTISSIAAGWYRPLVGQCVDPGDAGGLTAVDLWLER